ncbi:TonB-dependent receptor domain-containing protein [uncultured Sunxiuqinia sp.]|uniref:TonB-dependent receptor n=1 Tax=uncultured Sunxiuqinia sp. TaxID=1573825 RepID=UPI002AA82A89|nr:TonB-dependent receptor [uncultured Sunxiuqinia sp.]
MKKLSFKHSWATRLVFKRWGGQKYSLFQALNRQVRIGVLAVAYFMVSGINDAIAQPDSLEVKMEYDLDEIEVSAQRAPVTYSQVARIISVIEKDQTDAAPVNSIQDLLEYALSVDIRQRGTHGVQADVSVRGGSFDQTLILLNGINLSDPQTGHHSLNLPVSFKNIKRIEILEGPGARIYGPNAFSGAINIVTEPDDNDQATLDVTYGEHQLRDINVSANKQIGKLQSFVAFNDKASDGYIDNTDFKSSNIFYHGALNSDAGRLELQAGFSNKQFGANSFYTPKYPNQFEETKTTFASLKFETGEKLHFTPALYWRRHQDRFELFREDVYEKTADGYRVWNGDTIPSWHTGNNYHMTDILGTSINSWFASDLGKTAFGAEFRSENIWSNVLGEDLDEPIDVPGEDGQQFTKSHSRTTASFFAEHTFYLGRFTASGRAMANWISDLNFDWNIYPGIDLSYMLTEKLKLYGSFNKSLRMPTFTDLYYSGPTNQGNPNLKPERSTTIEGGVKLNNRYLHLQTGYYHRVGTDLIDWVRESEEFIWETRNLTEIKSDGFEFTGALFVPELIDASFFVRKINVNYSYNSLNRSQSEFLSNYALDNLKHKLVISIDHKIWKNLFASWNYRFQERNGTFTKFENKEPVGEANYEAFGLTDLKVYWKTPRLMLSASATNLFDKEYVDLGNIFQPGRWISFGVKYQIRLN